MQLLFRSYPAAVYLKELTGVFFFFCKDIIVQRDEMNQEDVLPQSNPRQLGQYNNTDNKPCEGNSVCVYVRIYTHCAIS